jgi:hypothetical protein
MLDEAPAEDGLYYGDSEPGVPGYVGGFAPNYFPTRIRITDPKGGFPFINGEKFINDSSLIFYLKKDCHHKYEWVNATLSQEFPFAIQPFKEEAAGFSVYIGRIEFEDFKAFLTVVNLNGLAGYTDKNGVTYFVKEYQVLTCKSKVFEEPPVTTTAAPGSDDPSQDPNFSGCGE